MSISTHGAEFYPNRARMIKANYTTEQLLEFERAGGVITNGEYPYDLSSTSPLHQWTNAFPNVAQELIVSWKSFCDAKHELDNRIREFNSLLNENQ